MINLTQTDGLASRDFSTDFFARNDIRIDNTAGTVTVEGIDYYLDTLIYVEAGTPSAASTSSTMGLRSSKSINANQLPYTSAIALCSSQVGGADINWKLFSNGQSISGQTRISNNNGAIKIEWIRQSAPIDGFMIEMTNPRITDNTIFIDLLVNETPAQAMIWSHNIITI